MQRADIQYLDFDIVLDRTDDGYFAHVVGSPAGPARNRFDPFSDLERERLNTFRAIVSGHRRGKRRIDSPEMHAAKDIGGRLFARVFAGSVGDCYRSCLDHVRTRPGTGLRVRLRMGSAPELADLPWEFLYDAMENQFLSLSVQTPLVRYLEIRRPVLPLAIAPPLRVLVMISNPSDIGDLDVEREWRQLREAVADLEARGLVAFDRLENATLEALQRQLRQANYHVFHYIGHAGFDEACDDGVLILEDERGRSYPVNAERLGNILHDEESLRLAVLNACEGARSSVKDPFSGLAQSLVQKGIPAVIAMQFEISDDAAITLSHEFYRALGEGYPADASLAEARKMIANANELEWGTPVLFLRSPDGHLFDVGAVDPAAAADAQARQEAAARAAHEAEAARRREAEEQRAAEEESRRQEEERRAREADAARAREERILAGIERAAAAPAARRRTSALTWLLGGLLIGILGLGALGIWYDSITPTTLPQDALAATDAAAKIVDPPPSREVRSPSRPSGKLETAAPSREIANVDEEERLLRRREMMMASLQNEVRQAIETAAGIEAEAFRRSDANLLLESYAGRAFEHLVSQMRELIAAGVHLDSELVGRSIQSIDVDPDGSAHVVMSETWVSEVHQNGTDLCLARIPRHAVPQRLGLARNNQGRWLITSVEMRGGDPETEPCY